MVYYKYEFNAKEDSNGEIEEEQKRCKTYRKCQMYLKGRAWWNGKKWYNNTFYFQRHTLNRLILDSRTQIAWK